MMRQRHAISPPQRPTPPRQNGGFSIIELLLVVTLIMVITSIVSPTFRMTPTREVENMAHLLVAHLEMARSESLGERRVVRVDFDIPGDTYVAYADHDANDSISAVAAEVEAFPAFGTRELADRVVFGRGSASAIPGDATSGAVTLPGNVLLLDRTGLPDPWGTMGTIYLTHERDNSAVAAISVTSSGSFKAWRWWPSPGEWR